LEYDGVLILNDQQVFGVVLLFWLALNLLPACIRFAKRCAALR
jgi:hypothetical protein